MIVIRHASYLACNNIRVGALELVYEKSSPKCFPRSHQWHWIPLGVDSKWLQAAAISMTIRCLQPRVALVSKLRP